MNTTFSIHNHQQKKKKNHIQPRTMFFHKTPPLRSLHYWYNHCIRSGSLPMAWGFGNMILRSPPTQAILSCCESLPLKFPGHSHSLSQHYSSSYPLISAGCMRVSRRQRPSSKPEKSFQYFWFFFLISRIHFSFGKSIINKIFPSSHRVN